MKNRDLDGENAISPVVIGADRLQEARYLCKPYELGRAYKLNIQQYSYLDSYKEIQRQSEYHALIGAEVID